MRSDGMKYFFVLMVIAVCRCFECPDGANCLCYHLDLGNFEIYCPDKYDTNLFINIHFMTVNVRCYEKSAWSDFNYYAPTELAWGVMTFVIVDCSWPELSFAELFGKMVYTDLTSLTFSEGSTKASTLTKRDLSGLRTLEELNLSFNAITELSPDVFEDLTKLNKLNFSSNRINVLPSDVFNLSTNLTSIDLSDNNITWIDEMLFRNLARLEHLSLMENRLTSLHTSIFEGLTSLQYLNLARNELSGLSKDLFRCSSNLQTLDISDNEFSIFDEEIFSNNTNLTRVYLSNNRVNITDSFAFFKFLISLDKAEELRLMKNNLVILPEIIFANNTHLKQLNLSNNAVKRLPETIFEGLGEMEILDLSANRLLELHGNIFDSLVKLKELYLQSNKLTFVFPIPASVEIFNANYNIIYSLASNAPVPAYPKLRVLRLSHNSLGSSTITIDFLELWLRDCKNIQEIYLDHNNIPYFTYHGLKDLSHLRLLDLSYNRLTSLQIAYFFRTSDSATIDVTHNSIGKFEVVPSGQTCARWRKNAVEKVLIRTGNNPVVCDCELYDLLRIYDERRDSNSEWCYRVDTDDLKCSDPAWLRGVPVANLGSKDFTCRREIDYSECPVDCECWWRRDDRTRLLDCSFRNLTQAPELIGGSSKRPIELNLTGNYLTELPSLNGSGYELVTKLFLSHNNISNVSFDVVSPILKVLQLEHNNLTSFDARTKNAIKQAENLDSFTLFDNPWDCDRETREILAYIDQKYSMETTVSARKQCLDQPTVQNRVQRRESYITVIQF